MKKIVILATALILATVSFGQKYCIVTKGYAFSKIIQPGNIPVDENGKPRIMAENKERFIYILSSCKSKPVITGVYYSKIKVSSSVIGDYEKTAEPGTDGAGKKIVLRAPKGFYLWRIHIADAEKVSGRPVRIIVQGKVGKNVFKITIPRETEVQGPEVY